MDNSYIDQEDGNTFSRKTVPFIEPYDFRYYKTTKGKIRIANIQVKSKLTNDLRLEKESEQSELILKYIHEAVDHEADLVVLPELSTSKGICDTIIEEFRDKDKVIVMGSYYDERNQNISEILIGGDSKIQVKNNPSKFEKRMQKGTTINIFINTPVGDFAVLICYDATDFTILTSLQDYTDFIICIAMDEDANLFDHMFRALTYLKYQYIIFCNDGQYGGSCIYAPFHGNRKLDTIGVDNQGIIYREIDLDEIDKMRGCQDKDKLKNWKYPPASAKPRSQKYWDKMKKIGLIKKQSFNYMNCEHDILKRFLSSIFSRMRCTKNVNVGSNYFSSIQCMYPPSLNRLADTSAAYILKEYMKQEDLINHATLISRLQNIYGKKYLLFEIDCDTLKHELSRKPEILQEIFNNHADDMESEK